MIIALAQQKGGVGKTTLAVNTAIELSRDGRKVLLVDADAQGTAADFTALRDEATDGKVGYTCVALEGKAVRTQILAMAPDYDDVVIDVGGRDSQALRYALTVAHVAVVPFQPRSFDVWTLGPVAELVSDAQAINPALVAVGVINMADPAGSDNAAAAAEIEKSGGDVIQYLDAAIARRKAWPNAAALGLGVSEASNRDAKAVGELQYFVEQLRSLDPANQETAQTTI